MKAKPPTQPLTLDEALVLFDKELVKRRHKWHLTAIAGWLDWDDVCQILRFHLTKKFFMYDHAQPFPHWANRIISRQISNLLRNYHSNYISPCARCACAEGNDLCAIYGHTQDQRCPLVKKWEKSKKQAYNIKLPLYLENHIDELHSTIDETLDIEKITTNVHEQMQELLSDPLELKVYGILFVHHRTDEEAIKELGFKNTSAGRAAGQKVINDLRRKIIDIAKALIFSGEVDLIYDRDAGKTT